MPAKKNKNYWKDRFEDLEKRSYNISSEAIREIEPAFDDSLREIQNEIERWYARLARNNEISITEAHRLLSASELKEFKWSVEDYIKFAEENELSGAWIRQIENASAKFHISRLESLTIKVRHQIERAFGNEKSLVSGMLSKVYEDRYYHTAFEISKGFGVGFDIASIDERRLDLFKTKPWAPDGRNFSDRIWRNKVEMQNTLHNEIVKTTLLGGSAGEAIETLAAFVDKKFRTAKTQAARLVRTEQAFFASAAQKKAFEDLDVEEFEIVATLDSRTSDICRDMDGKHFPLKEFVPGVTAPPFHVWCRSTTCPYFNDEFTAGEKRAARDKDGNLYYVPADMSYGEWEKEFVGKRVENITESGKIESKKVMEAPKTLQNFSEHGQKWEEEVVKNYLDGDEIEVIGAEIKKLIDENEFSMRVNHYDLEKILKDGKFKNQFETGTSGGSFNFDIRKRATKQLFGKGALKDASDYEKYGYLGHKDFIEEIHNSDVSQYGNCIIRFDKRLLEGKTTYTIDDSLGMAYNKLTVAGDVEKPSANGIDKNKLKFVSNLLKSDEKPIDLTDFWDKTNIRYIELQYHGEISTSLIKQICFTNEYLPSEEVIEELKKMGIEVFKVIGDWGGEKVVRI